VPTATPSPASAPGPAVVVVHNRGTVPIAHIILGCAAWGGWGGDQTGDVIAPGGTFTTAPQPGVGVYDLRAEDANHVILSQQMGVYISGTYDWYVGP